MRIGKKIFILLIFIFLLLFAKPSYTFAADNSSSRLNLVNEILKIIFNFGDNNNNGSNSNSSSSNNSSTSNPPSGSLPVDPRIARYFPASLGPISDRLTPAERNGALSCQSKKAIYEQAGSFYGMNWQILAALHFREAACGDGSLVSGRPIGQNEPDISTGCSSAITGPGVPVPVPGGGCGFHTLLDSAIYAARHLQRGIGRNPQNYQELVTAFGRYNGTGNRNCGRTPYRYCPPSFDNEDHLYSLNKFDRPRHNTMYLVYCADHVVCNPPRIFEGLGAMTVLRILAGR